MLSIYQRVENELNNPVNATDHNNTTKYRQADSRAIIGVLESKGFNHVATTVARTRDVKRIGKQRHIMIFERPDLLIDDGNKIQLLVTNSHDATSSLIINIGVFRVVCANGLVAGENFFEERIKHVGNDFYHRLTLGIDKAVTVAPKLGDLVRSMKGTYVNAELLAELCQNVAPCLDKEVFFTDLQALNRRADQSNDLYTVLNRIQENVIRGGVRYITEDKLGNDIIRKTREVKSIDKVRKLNQYVWDKCVKLIKEVA